MPRLATPPLPGIDLIHYVYFFPTTLIYLIKSLLFAQCNSLHETTVKYNKITAQPYIVFFAIPKLMSIFFALSLQHPI